MFIRKRRFTEVLVQRDSLKAEGVGLAEENACLRRAAAAHERELASVRDETAVAVQRADFMESEMRLWRSRWSELNKATTLTPSETDLLDADLGCKWVN